VTLTTKQKRFVSFYLGKAGGNATEAARLAGFTSPRQSAARLLSKEAIRQAVGAAIEKTAMEADEIVARLTQQASADMADFWDLSQSNVLPRLDLEKAKKAGLTRLIREMKVTREGEVQVKLYDAQKALELLGRYRGLWDKDSRQTEKRIIIEYADGVDPGPDTAVAPEAGPDPS
jgi:phage terminase small subunit